MYLHPMKRIRRRCLVETNPDILCFYFQVRHKVMNELFVSTRIWIKFENQSSINTIITCRLSYIWLLHHWYNTNLNLPLTRWPKWARHTSSAWTQVNGVLKYLKKTGEAMSCRSHDSVENADGTYIYIKNI